MYYNEKMEEIFKLYDFCMKRFEYPERWWSKRHFNIRCIDVWAYEDAICSCINSSKDNYDIIDNKILEYYTMINSKECDRITASKLRRACQVLNDMLIFIRKGRGL